MGSRDGARHVGVWGDPSVTAYYNEIDEYAAAWLENLISGGVIAPGDVDRRDIRDVRPNDLRGYTQCHFFAGIGIWSAALRGAGWPDDRPVWTGSCPCQPFSATGRRSGFADERHLWPHWHYLIRERRPGEVFGEQVASKDGLGWLDLVSADMEGEDYAFWPEDLCAAGVGSPNIRQRSFFVAKRLADAHGSGLEGCNPGAMGNECSAAERSGCSSRMADTKSLRRHGRGRGPAGDHAGSEAIILEPRRFRGDRTMDVGLAGPTNGFWRDVDWLFCRDGKWRPVEPGTFPLADGDTSRLGRIRAYGNAINREVAETFIAAYLDLETVELDRGFYRDASDLI